MNLSYVLRWNDGVHNTLVYGMLGVPVDSYEVNRLVNIATNHWVLDLGDGYTYLNMKTGREFSAVAELTCYFTFRGGVFFSVRYSAL